ncbi:MAG: hypothetical protein Ct9H300mP15_27040 [Gemmatimonadota bacterium]|nr:MAG: hypothetical protein Ct9H300mP15_27040 [Gemmatimonadota bacterium]
MLVDDQNHLRQRGGLSDRQLIVTDRFSSHAAVTTASRAGAGSGILLMGSGHLTSIDEIEGVRRSFIVHSLPSTFADLNGDFQFDETTESRRSHQLAVAIEGVAGEELTTFVHWFFLMLKCLQTEFLAVWYQTSRWQQTEFVG